MNPRVYLLTALLVSPAWAQGPASFDLNSDSIKKIVHAAAAAFSNLMLQCEVLKDIKSLPSDTDCPSAH